MYYWTCPYCGANLDPGEKCSCMLHRAGNSRWKKHEKLWTAGILVAGFGMCCLDSDGQAFAVAVAIAVVGFLITAAGFLAKKMSVKP